MNKFYETANIISIFFFMPVLIFLAYHARGNATGAQPTNEIRAEQPMPQLPVLPLKPGQAAARPEINVTPTPEDQGVGQQPGISPIPTDPAPTPEPQQPTRPGRRPGRGAYQPGRPYGGYGQPSPYGGGGCQPGNGCLIPGQSAPYGY